MNTALWKWIKEVAWNFISHNLASALVTPVEPTALGKSNKIILLLRMCVSCDAENSTCLDRHSEFCMCFCIGCHLARCYWPLRIHVGEWFVTDYCG